MSRKKRIGEVVCRCGAYPFPHRQFGGRCISNVMSTTWQNHQCDRCQSCRMFEAGEDGWLCQALEGRETFHEAECIIDHIAEHEIKLYGVNKPQ
jgi:hypothetical protein